MSPQRVFKVLIPPGYGSVFNVSGKIGPIPDTAILDAFGHCARIRLPSFIDDLVFTLKTHPFPEKLQNFYFLRDFFVVSETMKEFILGYLSADDVEIRKLRIHQADGTPTIEPYFALKIVRTIECIDSTQSTASDRFSKEIKPFSEITTAYELDQSLCAEFANKDGTHYVSYPWYLGDIRDVYLRDSEIPHDVSLFQPAFWPSFQFIEPGFGRLLENRCSGGNMGYYFWMLNLKGVNRSFQEMLVGMR